MTECLHDKKMEEDCEKCCGTQGRLEKLVCHKCESLREELTDMEFQNDCHSGSETCDCSENNGYPCYRHIDHEYRKLFDLNTKTLAELTKAREEVERLKENIREIAGIVGGQVSREASLEFHLLVKDEVRAVKKTAEAKVKELERQCAEQDALLSNPAVAVSVEGSKLVCDLLEAKAECESKDKLIESLSEALIEHRADLHGYSTRPCPTCEKSARALGIYGKVPNHCSRMGDDVKALTGPTKPGEQDSKD